ncbi:hypothetical protein [Pseudoxanthomonas kaohsiungensis]|uniref:Conjugal transfer protein n=1 Tax=Pseudoxanthomonas kaohsiungensis TaxID=283923 RepID=A0ABW3LYZ0_9GAMM|nr:hypothetical protein [Pseudoxanthomonas kaohsiungensis]KAF1702988.1 hypothetical protein CSC66_09445 [Pseudoxanthomonas kaohsiungensis]
MKRTFAAVALATSLGVGGYFAVSPSTACCGDGIAAAAGAESAGAAVVAAIGSAASSMSVLLNTINSNVTTGLAQVVQEISKQTASQKTIEEGTIQATTQLYMEEKRGDAVVDYALSPRACFEAQAATAVAGGASSVNQSTTNLMRGLQDRTLFTTNTAAAVDRVFRTHAEKFCSDRDVELGRCTRAADVDLQNADVRADNILGRDVLTADQLAAATAYLNNVINAVPTQNVPKGWERTPQGRAFVAGQLMEQSKLSTAALSMSRMVAMRRVEAGLGAKADLNVADVSPMQLMKSQVNGRFMDPNWYKMIVGPGFGEVNQLRESNKMQALELYLAMQAYEQGERIEAMLAADIATSIKRDSEQRLSQARAAAAKAQ